MMGCDFPFNVMQGMMIQSLSLLVLKTIVYHIHGL